MAPTSNVNTPSLKYEELEKLRTLPRDLMQGVERLRELECAKKYLPRNPTEAPERLPNFGVVDPWRNRVAMSRLKNMFKDAVDDCVEIGRASCRERVSSPV